MHVTTLALTPGTAEWLASTAEYVRAGLCRSSESLLEGTTLSLAGELRTHLAWMVSGHAGWREFCRDMLYIDSLALDELIAEYERRQHRERDEDAADSAAFGPEHRLTFEREQGERCRVCAGCFRCRWDHGECTGAEHAVRVIRGKVELLKGLATDGYLRGAGDYDHLGRGVMAAAHASLVASKVIVRRLLVEPDLYVRGLVQKGVVRGTQTGRRWLFVVAPGISLPDLVRAADAELLDVEAKLAVAISRAHDVERDRRLVMPASRST